jgi:hypothetical protein
MVGGGNRRSRGMVVAARKHEPQVVQLFICGLICGNRSATWHRCTLDRFRR